MLDSCEPLRFGGAAATPAPSLADRLDAEPLMPSGKRRAEAIVRMIRSLPKDGAIVIVDHAQAVAPMRQAIRQLRGPKVAEGARVFAAPGLRDEQAITQGLGLPVFRDAVVEELREHRRALAQAWRL